jgi:hypothetical protein
LKRLHCSLSLFFCLTLLCRIRNRQRWPALWVISQAKHKKNRNNHKGTLQTELNVHPPIESEQGPALPPKADEWPLGWQTKVAILQVFAVLWRKMGVFAMKMIQNRRRWLVAH